MNAFTSPQNRYCVMAGCGAFLALFAFFGLPYVVARTTVSMFGIAAGESRSISTMELDAEYGIIWLSALLAMIVLIIATLHIFSENSSSARGSVKTASGNSVQWRDYSFIGVGVLGSIIQVGVFVNLQQRIQETLSGASNLPTLFSTTRFSLFFGSGQVTLNPGGGIWFFLLGMSIIMMSGIVALRTK